MNRRIKPARACLVVFTAVSVLSSCSGRQEPPKIPLANASRAIGEDSAGAVEAAHALIGPAAKALLDSGNVLFRKKEYTAALAQYRAASSLAPQHSAPLFGIYMVARATNNPGMADSALASIRLRSGQMTPIPHAPADSALQRVHANLGKKPSAG
ncbi:MAG: hypothetical protein ABJF01_20215 [bacterium]